MRRKRDWEEETEQGKGEKKVTLKMKKGEKDQDEMMKFDHMMGKWRQMG